MALTFREVSLINRARSERWHPGFPDDDDWTIADWSNAMGGEAGEAQNFVKKIRRLDCGFNDWGGRTREEYVKAVAHELADVILYADLLATKLGIDLPEAIREKFNIVSDRMGFPERL